MHSRRITVATTLILAAILACNLPGGVEPLSMDDQAATIIAATMQEGLRNGGNVPITATFSQTPNPNPSSTSGPIPTITPTFSVPMLTVREQTNCRTGPGQDYEIVFTYLPDKKLVILGRYDLENYWLVKSDESPTGQCWLWGEFVEVSGSYWVVSSVTAPPTATIPPPLAPSIQEWDFFCSNANGTMEITIRWADRSNNETAYRILRNGQPVIDLPPNSTTYNETISAFAGDTFVYQIEVSNATGSTISSEISITC